MTAVSTQSFYIDQVHDVTVVCFTVSSISEQNIDLVSDELFEIVEYLTSNGPIQVVLDLWTVKRIDDWGVAMLRAFHETIETNGGSTIFCRIPHSVSHVLNEVGFGDWIHICETRSEALHCFTDA